MSPPGRSGGGWDGGWWPERRPPRPGPSPPRAKGRRAFGESWWGRAWIEALEGRARLDPNRLPRGRTYARSGAVGPLRLAAGEVEAKVQGSRAAPYSVHVRVRRFEEPEWERVLDALAAEIGHAAALLDGELPPEVAADVASVGLDLLPGPGELQPRCSCPDFADPCKHSAAVCYLVADALDEDAFGVLLLRGLGREEVLAALRARRRGAAGPGAGGMGELAGSAEDADPGVPAREAWSRWVDLGRPGAPPAGKGGAGKGGAGKGGAGKGGAGKGGAGKGGAGKGGAGKGGAGKGGAGKGGAGKESRDAAPLRLPEPVLPELGLPRRPGRPTVLAADPPPGSGLDAAGLRALAADAAARALELARGGRSGLELNAAEDLARRAAALLSPGAGAGSGSGAASEGTGRSTAGGGAGPGIAELARRAGMAPRELLARALAWRDGGPGGLAALVESWDPEPPAMSAGRALLGTGTVIRRNRAVLGDRQLRLGRDGSWYPFRKDRSGAWLPDGQPVSSGFDEAFGRAEWGELAEPDPDRA